MSVDQHARAVSRHREEIARLQRDKSRVVEAASSDSKKAVDAMEAAGRMSSEATIRSRLREAQRYEKRGVAHQKKIAEFERKIAEEHRRLRAAEKKLANAQREADQKRRRDQERADRERKRQMSEISSTLSHHSALHGATLSAIERLEAVPSEITVLFLASNPIDQQHLRLDEEVRAIGEMIRKSDHRDSVRLESRWAVRPIDVLQAINETTPAVVHFSGHGSNRAEIVLQDVEGRSQTVPKAALVATLAASSGDIRLVLFNLCSSISQAEAAVEHVPAAIGMNTSIGDDAARVFAAQFYSAIGFGHSVGLAFDQARAALMLEGIPEEGTPELFLAPGVSAEALVLVEAPSMK
ncbi:CHAT domain-containing protein [Gaopeijia maritima]|uniref:CHAT domain-containing protein n=1 Tax=Gaopeijia maritima TaxID=3119007 RepID=UPI0032435A42